MDLPQSSADAPRQVRLSEVIDQRVPIAWHEAVALARVLAIAARQQAPPILLPELSQVLIDTDGDVITEGGEPVGDEPTRHISAILGRLISAEHAPNELVVLQRDSMGLRGAATLKEFIDGLTFFARPDDKLELATLAKRALAYQQGRLHDEALASLTRKARGAQDSPAPAGKAADSPRSARLRSVKALGAVAVLLVAAAAFAWLLTTRAAGQGVGFDLPLVEVARRVQTEVVSGVTAVQQQLGFAAAITPAGGDRELPAPRRPAAKRAEVNGRPPLPAELADGVVGDGDGPVGTPADDPAATGIEVLPESEPVDLAVYTGSDVGVLPPTLTRPQMPAERIEGISLEAAGDLELLVGLDGRVEQARLVPASNRFQDRMMVSAAKTWRFAPATKDGQPVRYRLLIPITW